jgi:hypothetical protein
VSFDDVPINSFEEMGIDILKVSDVSTPQPMSYDDDL